MNAVEIKNYDAYCQKCYLKEQTSRVGNRHHNNTDYLYSKQTHTGSYSGVNNRVKNQLGQSKPRTNPNQKTCMRCG